MPGVFIDTDVAIDFLRGMAYTQPLFAGLWKDSRAIISVLTLYELTAGMKDVEKNATHDFIAACQIEQISPEIAFKAGDLYRKYRAKGITLTSMDCLIAATALTKGYKVATRNIRHYPEKGILFPIEAVEEERQVLL